MPPSPVFAFLAFTSGSYEGAIIRDMRLANALHRRGYRVIVYWMMEQNRKLLDAGIPQRVLCNGMRYQFTRPSAFMDALWWVFRPLFPEERRRRFVLQHPDYLDRLMSNCCRAICDGDPKLSRRLAKFISEDHVTHLLPTFAMICPFAQAARDRELAVGSWQLAVKNRTDRNSAPPPSALPTANRQLPTAFNYLVTFQGEEIFANFAERIGRLSDYHARLRETLDGSPWTAVAVSADYIQRLHEEMGIDAARMRPIYPGIELPPNDAPRNPAADFQLLRGIFKSLRPGVPIVTYLGRQDAEKGIDLLLYAAKLLQQRGVPLQLLCVGGSSFGQHYNKACEQIAEHLRLTVFWKRRVTDDVRTALYRASRCIVYPSIHREPFGMVAAEAMSHGTPVLVPDHGGITEVITHDTRRGGITFKAWDTADLAEQLRRLLTDDALHASLAADARAVAENFSVDQMTDRVLAHMGIAPVFPETVQSLR